MGTGAAFWFNAIRRDRGSSLAGFCVLLVMLFGWFGTVIGESEGRLLHRRGGARAARAGSPVPGTTCDVFPANNVWHLDVSRLPTHPKSDVWKKAMRARATFLHPDFGPPAYGIPFDVVDAAHPDVSVHFTYASESDKGSYPFNRTRTSRAGPIGTRS